MASINVCPNCGLEKRCRSCNPCCSQCGTEVERVDYVAYILSKQQREVNNGKNENN